MIAFLLFLMVLAGVGAAFGWRTGVILGAWIAAIALAYMVLS